MIFAKNALCVAYNFAVLIDKLSKTKINNVSTLNRLAIDGESICYALILHKRSERVESLNSKKLVTALVIFVAVNQYSENAEAVFFQFAKDTFVVRTFKCFFL